MIFGSCHRKRKCKFSLLFRFGKKTAISLVRDCQDPSAFLCLYRLSQKARERHYTIYYTPEKTHFLSHYWSKKWSWNPSAFTDKDCSQPLNNNLNICSTFSGSLFLSGMDHFNLNLMEMKGKKKIQCFYDAFLRVLWSCIPIYVPIHQAVLSGL